MQDSVDMYLAAWLPQLAYAGSIYLFICTFFRALAASSSAVGGVGGFALALEGAKTYLVRRKWNGRT